MSRSRVSFILLWFVLLAGIAWAQTPLTFIPTGPCRVMDTRWHQGPFGGPSLAAGTVRTVTIPDNRVCSIPDSAAAYSLNVTVVPHGFLGYITIWPSGLSQPVISTLNSVDGRIKAVAAMVPAGTDNAINVYATNETDLVLDITGYFVGPGNPNALYYYPMSRYCDLINTFDPPRPDGLAGPALQAGVARSFQVTNTPNCADRIPAEAAAYSLNIVATPVNGPLGYITVWPSDQAQPYTSTLNAVTGAAVANAAIVKAGTGAISVYATHDTNIQVYINGFFGPKELGGVGSGDQRSGHIRYGDALYNLSPCRGNDTRPYQFTDRIDYILQSQGGCQTALPPINGPYFPIDAYVLNATVVPEASLGDLAIWPYGRQMPIAPTLVATDGAITSNMAIVPVVTHDAELSAFASAPTNLIYDVFGYFASPELDILTRELAPGTFHVPYTFTMRGRGGVPPYTWAATGLPNNLEIDAATGTISGCPVSAEPGSLEIGLTDVRGTPVGAVPVAMAFEPLPPFGITTDESLPDGTRNTPYTVPLTAEGGYGAYTWSIVDGGLPPGLSLSTNGVVSGYLSGQRRGTWSFQAQVADEQCQGTPLTRWFSIYVD